MASISRALKGLASELARPGPNWPGETNSRLLPSFARSAVTLAVVPLPIVTMAITAPTPMMMPSTVRNERSVLRRIDWSASLMASISIMPPPAGHVGIDAAVDETDDAPGEGSHVGFVCHHDDRDALVTVEAGQQVHDLPAGLGVEIAGRLVGQQDGGLGDDGARDGDALLLAAGQLARRVIFAASQPDAGQRVAGPARRRSAGGMPR